MTSFQVQINSWIQNYVKKSQQIKIKLQQKENRVKNLITFIATNELPPDLKFKFTPCLTLPQTLPRHFVEEHQQKELLIIQEAKKQILLLRKEALEQDLQHFREENQDFGSFPHFDREIHAFVPSLSAEDTARFHAETVLLLEIHKKKESSASTPPPDTSTPMTIDPRTDSIAILQKEIQELRKYVKDTFQEQRGRARERFTSFQPSQNNKKSSKSRSTTPAPRRAPYNPSNQQKPKSNLKGYRSGSVSTRNYQSSPKERSASPRSARSSARKTPSPNSRSYSKPNRSKAPNAKGYANRNPYRSRK